MKGEGHAGPELVGQGHALDMLQSYRAREWLPPLLFAGLPGVGRRTAAIRFAQALNCDERDAREEGEGSWGCGACRSCRTIALLRHPDVKLVFPIPAVRTRARDDEGGDTDDAVAATFDRYPDYVLGHAQPTPDPKHRIRIELVRWLRAEMARPAVLARRRVVAILHADRMTDEAANALLKTLEEPHERTAFILTTSIPSALPDTIRSRCRTIRFAALSPETVAGWLERHYSCAPDQAQLAAAVAQGSLARALRYLAAPAELMPGPVVSFVSKPGTEAALLRAVGELARVPQSSLTDALLLLFREMLRFRLGFDSVLLRQNPDLAARAGSSGPDYLRRALKYLLERDEESSLYTNPRLSVYTLLTALRFPGQAAPPATVRGRRSPGP